MKKEQFRERARRVVKKLFFMILRIYILVVALIFLFQNRLVFFPMRKHVANPSDWGFPFEDVTLITSDDLQLHGWYIPTVSQENTTTVLFFHGNAGNISHRFDTFRILGQMGLNVFMIDYRGYGKSQGKPTEQGVYEDARTAWNWLIEEKGLAAGQIVIHGRSLGGVVAAHLAGELGVATGTRPRALVLESTFTDAVGMARKRFPFYPRPWLVRVKLEAGRFVQQARCPILVIHSPTDEIVSYQLGRDLYDRAPQPKQFLEIAGSHNTGFIESQVAYIRGIKDFLEQTDPPDE